jgi:hypothetical protein
VDVVFERDGYAMERTADPSCRTLAVELRGFVERARIDCDRRMYAVLVHRQPDQILADDLAGRDAPGCQSGLQFREARLGDSKRWLGQAVSSGTGLSTGNQDSGDNSG